MIKGVLDGINASMLMYGQLGSRKSHTLLGNPLVHEERGLLLRIVDGYFSKLKSHKSSTVPSATETFISYFELRDDRIVDLLSTEINPLEVKDHVMTG